MRWHGIVIAESLEDPALINDLTIYGAHIGDEGLPIDYDGGLGRWHTYWVEVSDSDIDLVQRDLLHGWYAHFWRGDDLLVVYDDERFRLSRAAPATWDTARAHGRAQGIPDAELDFLTAGPDEAHKRGGSPA